MMPSSHFPFSAVVGNDDVKLALMLTAVDPAIGGVLLRGHKGSAKTTLARGLAGVLPGDARFVELPVGATEDRVVGSLDLAAALTSGEVTFRPGLLAGAHEGVLYVDEVNLLPDHLVDVLLDVAVSGVNRVEREGMSHVHPSRFVLIGSMNPEEGELRPQLLDRFGLSVDVVTSTDPDERAGAVHRRMEFDRHPEGFIGDWHPEQERLREHVAQARARCASLAAAVTDSLLRTISALCASAGAEGLRADLVICRAARALALLESRTETTVDDVRRVAPLALAHRRRRQPFEDPGISPEEVDEHLDRASQPPPPQSSPPPEQLPQEPAEPPSSPDSGESSAEERTAVPDAPGRVVRLEAPTARGNGDGRRSNVTGERGRFVSARPPAGGAPLASVAVTATATAAAVRRATTAGHDPAAATDVQPGDLREAVRQQRAGNLVILAVDASGSMGAEHRMEAVKGAVISLLLDAYQRRDRVALVTFRGDGANVVLRPTGSVEVARARLDGLPTGGRTPLHAGIGAALDLAMASNRSGNSHRPLIVLVSDGRATSSPPGSEPLAAACDAAAAVRRQGIPAVVIDAEEGPVRLGLAAAIAANMGARYLTIPELSAGALEGAVRSITDIGG